MTLIFRIISLAITIFGMSFLSIGADESLTWESTKQNRGLWTLITPKAPDLIEAKKVELGKKLFFDPELSADRTVMCATCHHPKAAFSDPQSFSIGFGGKVGTRHSPKILNLSVSNGYFWDGRAKTLEEQALIPISNSGEMNLPISEAVSRLNANGDYFRLFNTAFNEAPSADRIAQSLAAYERQIFSSESPFDKWVAGDESAMRPDAKIGFLLFAGKANCAKCHLGPNFTDNKFHNLGVGMDKPLPDLGRFLISTKPGDKGAFKTPNLRESALIGPYFHDGSARTLEDVIDFYAKGGLQNPWISPLMVEVKLSAEEKASLIKFLESLSGKIHQP